MGTTVNLSSDDTRTTTNIQIIVRNKRTPLPCVNIRIALGQDGACHGIRRAIQGDAIRCRQPCRQRGVSRNVHCRPRHCTTVRSDYRRGQRQARTRETRSQRTMQGRIRRRSRHRGIDEEGALAIIREVDRRTINGRTHKGNCLSQTRNRIIAIRQRYLFTNRRMELQQFRGQRVRRCRETCESGFNRITLHRLVGAGLFRRNQLAIHIETDEVTRIGCIGRCGQCHRVAFLNEVR